MKKGISSRIDHVLPNDPWSEKYVRTVAQYLNPWISDHSPLVLCLEAGEVGGGRPFRFFKHLASHPQFLSIIQRVWNVQGKRSMREVRECLKKVMGQLKMLLIQEYKGDSDRIQSCRDQLDNIQ